MPLSSNSARPNGFNSYAAGDKKYGSGRNAPNVGPTGDPTGYAERNLQIKARQNAILRRLKSNSKPGPGGPIGPGNSLVGGI